MNSLQIQFIFNIFTTNENLLDSSIIKHIPWTCFKIILMNNNFPDIPYLRELRLHDNPLQKLEANAFEMVPQLVSLDLTNCNIKKIAAKAFAHLNNLEKLYLSNNTWVQISSILVKAV